MDKGNRLDKFLSTIDFGGLDLKWGFDSNLYHYSPDVHLESMREDLSVINLAVYKNCGELDGGLEYLRKRDFPIDGEIWHAALKEFADENFEEAASRYGIFSLCREGKSEYMWEKYSHNEGKGKPCIMTFDGKKIYDKVEKLIAKDLEQGYSPNGTLHFFLPCFYQPGDNDKISRLAAFITGNEYYGHLCRESNWKDADKLTLAKDIIVMFALMIKNGTQYQEEQETRLIVVGNQPTATLLRSVGLGFDPIVSVRYSLEDSGTPFEKVEV